MCVRFSTRARRKTSMSLCSKNVATLLLGTFLLLLEFERTTSQLAPVSGREPPAAIRRPHRPTLTLARHRHSRHLHTPGQPVALPYKADSETSFSYKSSYEIKGQSSVQAQDNHKPVFTNCSQYQPVIKEEERERTPVLVVKADDPDPIDNGGLVKYTFVSAQNERLKFDIDPNTGNITTAHVFDRDEPYREKEAYITVRATDNGHPQLDAVCTIKVTIEDVNDNDPVFDRVSYVESIPQDFPVNREVMRISATDIDDGNNSRVLYTLDPSRAEDAGYFRVDSYTGVINLIRTIDKDPGYRFKMRATATDQGSVPRQTHIDPDIVVVESHKKPPTFSSITPAQPIFLKENFMDFNANITTLTAQSNSKEQALVFELVTGRTEQTNKLNAFRLEPQGNTAYIRLARLLDYETVVDYLLTVRIQNKYNLAAETTIVIRVEDVNDNIPVFAEVLSGSVLENEPVGTPVMQVRAIDADATSAHNQVTYELGDNNEYFAIDRYTGNIATKVVFDREQRDIYNVKVIATDNSPSALYQNGDHNKGQQVFRIEIADKNDHPPRFTQEIYVAESVLENANVNALVTEVKALDNDTASPVRYFIIEGNYKKAFMIEETTGKIRVANQLDYEETTNYTLRVRAFDNAFEDFCLVKINIQNVNDNPPVFSTYQNNITIQEETLVNGCIAELSAYDPDIPDRSAPQHIVYFVVKQDQQKLLHINKDGCLYQKKPLDRDPPNGYETWQILIAADDEDGNATSVRSTTEVYITLTDINDNAPYLDIPQPVVWRENQQPGVITKLRAKDNDGPDNGPPFRFEISVQADITIRKLFDIRDGQLYALETFDREAKKDYRIPIAITDSPKTGKNLTGISILHIVIGDENDNEMKPGESSIFVYNYKGESPDTEIGRVYVEDPDDWDLPDKQFFWTSQEHPYFKLNAGTGMITMLNGTEDGNYQLHFSVTEESVKIRQHTVDAVVNVTVREIPEEAVDKSGSIRFVGITAEEFITPDENGVSKHFKLKHFIAEMLNVSAENVDVFTVLHSPHNTNTSLLDIRFSAHGSPYYAPERLNAATSMYQEKLERDLNLSILMISIDECLVEKSYCESSCTNFLNKSNIPQAILTNTTSFVGVRAVVDPFCQCPPMPKQDCMNGGTPIGDKCECIDGFEGPYCEVVNVGFYGDGWALYPTPKICPESTITLYVRTQNSDGLVFYLGPMSRNHHLPVQDFMSLELANGFPVLLVDYGTGTVQLTTDTIGVSDGEFHRIDIIWSKASLEMKVDNCQKSACLALRAPVGPNEFLNVNGPLQVGGSKVNLPYLSKQFNWSYTPKDKGFHGCVRNFTFNGHTYNLGMPSMSKNADPGCNRGMAKAVSFGINTSFIATLLVCVAVLLILLLSVVVRRRKSDDLYKDTDDIRENIINYEDEGGGEGDMTGYDLNVLRLVYNGDNNTLSNDKLASSNHLPSRDDEAPDLSNFLDGKKKAVDADPDFSPFDDARHYAYEGDGNTSGSLSSLKSGTDDGDLNFDFLSNFGPRFRKLADMYGEDPSDEEEDNYNIPASESWC